MPNGQVPVNVPMDAKLLQGIINYMTNHDIKLEDWTNIITMITRGDTEFFNLSHEGGAKLFSTKNRKYDYSIWYDEPSEIQLPASLTASNGSITLPKQTVNIGALFRDVVFNYEDVNSIASDPVYYRITGEPIVNGDNIRYNVVRLEDDENSTSGTKENAGVTAAQIREDLQGKLINVLYTSKPAGGEDNNPIFWEIETGFNFVQTHQHHVHIDDYTNAEAWRHNVSPRDWQIGRMAVYHAREIEKSFWFGKALHDVKKRIGEDRTMTRGFFNHKGVQKLATYRQDFTFYKFIDYCEQYVMAYNKNKDLIAWVNPAFLTFVVHMMDTPGAKAYMTFDANGKENTYGVNIHKLVTPHCNFELRVNNTLRDYFKSTPIFVSTDMDKVCSRFLSGNSESLATKLSMNVQIPDANYFLDKMRSTYGFQLQAEKCHSFLKLVNKVEEVIVP